MPATDQNLLNALRHTGAAVDLIAAHFPAITRLVAQRGCTLDNLGAVRYISGGYRLSFTGEYAGKPTLRDESIRRTACLVSDLNESLRFAGGTVRLTPDTFCDADSGGAFVLSIDISAEGAQAQVHSAEADAVKLQRSEEQRQVLAREVARLLKRQAELIRERDQWKANHDNQVKLKRILTDRPDLKERAQSMQNLLDRVDQALEAKVVVPFSCPADDTHWEYRLIRVDVPADMGKSQLIELKPGEELVVRKTPPEQAATFEMVVFNHPGASSYSDGLYWLRLDHSGVWLYPGERLTLRRKAGLLGQMPVAPTANPEHGATQP